MYKAAKFCLEINQHASAQLEDVFLARPSVVHRLTALMLTAGCLSLQSERVLEDSLKLSARMVTNFSVLLAIKKRGEASTR